MNIFAEYSRPLSPEARPPTPALTDGEQVLDSTNRISGDFYYTILAMRNRWLGLAAISFCAAVLLQAATPTDGKERLRRLIHLPTVSVGIGVNFDSTRGFEMMSQQGDAKREIEEINKLLVGNGADAPRHFRLACLYAEAGDRNQGAIALDRALTLYRQQDAGQSDNGKLLAAYGEALNAAGRTAEAERVLRQGIKVAPREWTCRVALGRFLTREAFGSLLGGERKSDGLSPLPSSVADLLARKPSAGQVEKARKLADDSVEQYNEAVSLAPSEPEAHAGRALCLSGRNMVKTAIRIASGEESDPARFATAPFTAEALPDLQQVARLRPKDHRAIGTAVLFEVFCVEVERGASQVGSLIGATGWGNMPDTTRESVPGAVGRLEELGQSGDSFQAAGALAVLGAIQCLVIQDQSGAEANLRRAVKLDPSRDAAWELLMGIVATNRRFPELQTLAETRLKAVDTPRNRLILAKALDRLDQTDRCLAEAEAARRRFPNDFGCTLAVAAALLKSEVGKVLLNPIDALITRAEQLLGLAPTREALSDLLLTRGLFYGLSDQPDLARASLNKLLELDRDNADARDALAALE